MKFLDYSGSCSFRSYIRRLGRYSLGTLEFGLFSHGVSINVKSRNRGLNNGLLVLKHANSSLAI